MEGLRWEADNIRSYLDRFERSRGRTRSASLDPSGEFITIKNLPLPDSYSPDAIDILLLTDQWPSQPPHARPPAQAATGP